MKKIKLKESDLTKIVKRIINEQSEEEGKKLKSAYMYPNTPGTIEEALAELLERVGTMNKHDIIGDLADILSHYALNRTDIPARYTKFHK